MAAAHAMLLMPKTAPFFPQVVLSALIHRLQVFDVDESDDDDDKYLQQLPCLVIVILILGIKAYLN